MGNALVIECPINSSRNGLMFNSRIGWRGGKFGMSAFWMGILAAQRAASGTKAADRRHHVLSMVGGIALALVIGAGLFIAAGLTN
jgi:hypothetical protein